MKWWPHRVHAFLLGVTEVNCALADNYFYENDDNGQLQFRKEMAKELIYNRYLEQEDSRNGPATRRRAMAAHRLENLPRNFFFVGLKWWNRSSHIRNTNAFRAKKRLELIVFALRVSTEAMNA